MNIFDLNTAQKQALSDLPMLIVLIIAALIFLTKRVNHHQK